MVLHAFYKESLRWPNEYGIAFAQKVAMFSVYVLSFEKKVLFETIESESLRLEKQFELFQVMWKPKLFWALYPYLITVSSKSSAEKLESALYLSSLQKLNLQTQLSQSSLSRNKWHSTK